MRISYYLPIEFSEHIEHTAHLSACRLDVAAFFFPCEQPFYASRISGRKATFSHLPGYTFVFHKTPSGEYHLTEEHTGALCASVNFAKNYKNAFDKLMDTIFVTDVLASQELFENAISSYFAKIRESVQSLTDDPELYLFGERCRYRRERNERKQCLQALA